MQKLYLYIEPWIYRLLLVSFFIPHGIQTFIFILFCCWVGVNAIQQKVFLRRKEFFVALLLGGGYLFYVAYLPLTQPDMRHVVYSLLERKISLFALPFIIPLALKLSDRKFSDELKWFVFANVVHGLVLNMIVLLQLSHNTALINVNHVAYRDAFDAAGGIHPTYYGMYICFSLVILLYDASMKVFHKVLLTAIHGTLLLFLLLLSPKISLLILLLVYGYYFFFVLAWKPNYKIILCLCSMALLVTLFFTIPFFQQRVQEVFSFFNHDQMIGVQNSVSSRRFILDVDMKLLKENWLFGVGPAMLEHNLNTVYSFTSYMIGIPLVTYNTHNEYINQWLCFGLGGFLYFIIVFLIQLRKAYRHKDFVYIFFQVIVMITCLTENILSRQQGILFVALLGSLFYFQSVKNEKVKQ